MNQTKENEILVWTVAVGLIPPIPKIFMPKKVAEAVDLIKEQEGLIGVTPMPPRGTLLLFDTENHAKGARNVLKFHGVMVGDNICKAFVDKRYLEEGENGEK